MDRESLIYDIRIIIRIVAMCKKPVHSFSLSKEQTFRNECEWILRYCKFYFNFRQIFSNFFEKSQILIQLSANIFNFFQEIASFNPTFGKIVKFFSEIANSNPVSAKIFKLYEKSQISMQLLANIFNFFGEIANFNSTFGKFFSEIAI